MLHPFQHIVDLSEICHFRGINSIVISPGSRNAPLINAFYSRFGRSCYSIVDERSAGYFALGIAWYTRAPVVLISTSGTAALNYSPAIAEAYYSQIPLLVITADRPGEWIDQLDNQTIRQKEVYRNFIKRSYHLPEIINNEQMLRDVHYQLQEAISYTQDNPRGPVHINVPLDEPLYTDLPSASKNIASFVMDHHSDDIFIPDELSSAWQNAGNILIIHGQDHPQSGATEVLFAVSELPGVVVIAESISNVNSDTIISLTDPIFSRFRSDLLKSPDLLIYSGGQVVSKRLKKYLRDFTHLHTWRIGVDDFPIDTFKKKNSLLSAPAVPVYARLTQIPRNARKHTGYKESWQKVSAEARKLVEHLQKKLPFSDISAMQIILDNLPLNSNLELGNSSAVRLAQFFKAPDTVQIFSNRGVSGIDGCLSAASGTAVASNQLTIAVLGDLSFVYDSNALWNSRLSQYLKVIVLNNRGGGIFSLLEGPSKKIAYEEFFIAYHPVHLQKLAEAFNLDYFCCKDAESLTRELPRFFQANDKAGVLEIKTEREKNIIAYKMVLGTEDTLKNRNH